MASMLLPFASVELVAVFVILARVIVTCSQGLVTIIAALVINRVAADSSNPQPAFCQGPIETSYPDHGEDRDL